MSELVVPFDSFASAEPAYARAGKEIWKMLSEMSEGDQLLPERQLCVQLGVSRVTLRKALEPFHRSGVLQAKAGGGTRLCGKIQIPAASRTANRFIGLVVPSVENPLIARIVRGAEEFVSKNGFYITLAHDHGNLEQQISQMGRMADGGVGGIAIYPDTSNVTRPEFREAVREIQSRKIPLVMIDRYLPEVESVSVLSDNYAGMFSAAEHMILTGHRRLALLAFGPDGGIADRDRRRGFEAAMEEYGFEGQPAKYAALGGCDHERKAEQVVRQWLKEGSGVPAFDAIVCMQDNMAYGAYLALKKAGIDVPERVGLIGYDNLDRELYRSAGLELSTIEQPAEEIGKEAARLLADQIRGIHRAGRAKHLLLKPRLIVRKS